MDCKSFLLDKPVDNPFGLHKKIDIDCYKGLGIDKLRSPLLIIAESDHEHSDGSDNGRITVVTLPDSDIESNFQKYCSDKGILVKSVVILQPESTDFTLADGRTIDSFYSRRRISYAFSKTGGLYLIAPPCKRYAMHILETARDFIRSIKDQNSNYVSELQFCLERLECYNYIPKNFSKVPDQIQPNTYVILGNTTPICHVVQSIAEMGWSVCTTSMETLFNQSSKVDLSSRTLRRRVGNGEWMYVLFISMATPLLGDLAKDVAEYFGSIDNVKGIVYCGRVSTMVTKNSSQPQFFVPSNFFVWSSKHSRPVSVENVKNDVSEFGVTKGASMSLPTLFSDNEHTRAEGSNFSVNCLDYTLCYLAKGVSKANNTSRKNYDTTFGAICCDAENMEVFQRQAYIICNYFRTK